MIESKDKIVEYFKTGIKEKKDFKIETVKPVMICVFDKKNMGEYIKILKKIRSANINSEIYPGEGKLKKQMEYANKIQSPCVIFYGDDEVKNKEVKLRNLKTGDETLIKIEDLTNEINKIIWQNFKIHKIKRI